ncbi:MAG: hypothetical protein Q8928_16910 [Bacteroidota bacterium]|nr:hypothetical protein [Bacteroidota bacterium]
MKNIIVTLFLMFFCLNCKNKEPIFNNLKCDNFELSPQLRSVLKEYIDSVQKADSTIKIFYLTLNKHDENTSIYWLTGVKELETIEEYPPLKYMLLENKYILFSIAYNKQVISGGVNKLLYKELSKYLSPGLLFHPRCWEITFVNDSLNKVCKSCCRGHQFVRKRVNIIYTPPTRSR